MHTGKIKWKCIVFPSLSPFVTEEVRMDAPVLWLWYNNQNRGLHWGDDMMSCPGFYNTHVKDKNTVSTYVTHIECLFMQENTGNFRQNGRLLIDISFLGSVTMPNPGPGQQHP